jgi:hypothetical protein
MTDTDRRSDGPALTPRDDSRDRRTTLPSAQFFRTFGMPGVTRAGASSASKD